MIGHMKVEQFVNYEIAGILEKR